MGILVNRGDDIGDVQIFLFGSVQRRESGYSDVDLLVTYRSAAELKEVRSILRELGREFPLDVIYMYPEEEQEVDFIRKQKCKRIFPP